MVVPSRLAVAGLVGRLNPSTPAVQELPLAGPPSLNELVATGQWQKSTQNGTAREGLQEFRWSVRLEPWNQTALRLMTVQVFFPVQGRDYDVRLSTIVDTTLP